MTQPDETTDTSADEPVETQAAPDADDGSILRIEEQQPELQGGEEQPA